MQSIREQRESHSRRMNVTEADERYYIQTKALSEGEKKAVNEEVETIHKKIKDRIKCEDEYREKRFEDTCDKEERLW